MLNREDQISFDRFIDAARDGDLPTIERYILQHRERGDLTAAVNAANQYGNTALIFAAENDHIAVVLTLLAIPGIDVNAVGEFGDTALICAAENGHTAIVLVLLTIPGINLDAQNENLRTAAAEAAQHVFFEIANQLATIIAQGQPNQTPAVESTAADNQSADILTSTHHAAPSFAERLTKIPDFDETSIPKDFIDPITREIMTDPIVFKCGHTYERSSMIAYFFSQQNPEQINCPGTPLYIARSELHNNTCLLIRNLIEQFVIHQEDEYKKRQEQQRVTSAAAAAVLNLTVTGENKSNDEAMPDAEKLRMARLKVFGGTLPASNTTLSLAAQPAGQDDEMAIDRRP